MTWKDDPEEGSGLLPIIRKSVEPVEASSGSLPSESLRGKWDLFRRGVKGLWERLWGWSWPQIDRLREAKLRELETANEEREAAAESLRTEALLREAEAELTFVRAEREKIKAIKEKLELSGGELQPNPEEIQPAEDALADAIEVLRMKGGNIRFGPGTKATTAPEESDG